MMIKNSILNKIKKIESVYKPPDDKPVLIIYFKEFQDLETDHTKNLFSIMKLGDDFDEIMSQSNSTEKEVLQAIKDNPNVLVLTGGNENEFTNLLAKAKQIDEELNGILTNPGLNDIGRDKAIELLRVKNKDFDTSVNHIKQVVSSLLLELENKWKS